MDKQEYREFLEEIKKSYNAGKYEQVAAYSDELDFGKIKEPRILEMISDSYDHLGETDNAIDALAAAFARNKTSKQTAYRLGELCIKAGDLDGAVEYYEDFRKLSNNSIKGLILKYEIGKAGGVPAAELIKVLEKFTAKEKDEKWEYELARLYHENGDVQKCIDTCDNICLWYSEGEYVKKALELKFSHTALTPAQQVQYEKMMQDYMDPGEMTQLPDPEEDEIALQLADEYLAGEEEKEKPVRTAPEEMTDTAKFDALQDTRVIPIDEIMGEIDAEAGDAPESTEAIVAEAEVSEAENEDTQETDQAAAEEEPAQADEAAQEESVQEEAEPEPEKPSNRITFEELRAMIQNGNSKKAQSGVFFTYSEPTAEDIAEEEALKAARAEARRRAEEEAARKAAEEQAAREAAEAAAREAARLEEEARVEAALLKAEEEEKAAEQEKNDEPSEAADMEIDETKFINREELLARLSEDEEEEKKEEEETTALSGEDEEFVRKDFDHESLGFTAMIDMIAAEVDIDENAPAAQEEAKAPAAPEEAEVPASSDEEDDGATIIFSRAEIEAAIENSKSENAPKTPQEKLGEAIDQIIDDANAAVLRDMEETKSIRIVLPSASANKIGQASVKLSQYASSVIKPPLSDENASKDAAGAGGAPRIIDNVDFSYIPISRDDDGQLGLNIEDLILDDEFAVEGQLTIDDVLNSYSKKLDRNKARVLDIESERLRQIQEAVNLTAPVKLPYSMDDLIFDDIEMSDIDGNVEEVEGDIFQFDPESIGVIPSDEELLARAKAEEKQTEEIAETEMALEEPEPADEEPVAEEEPVASEDELVAESQIFAEGDSEEETPIIETIIPAVAIDVPEVSETVGEEIPEAIEELQASVEEVPAAEEELPAVAKELPVAEEEAAEQEAASVEEPDVDAALMALEDELMAEADAAISAEEPAQAAAVEEIISEPAEEVPEVEAELEAFGDELAAEEPELAETETIPEAEEVAAAVEEPISEPAEEEPEAEAELEAFGDELSAEEPELAETETIPEAEEVAAAVEETISEPAEEEPEVEAELEALEEELTTEVPAFEEEVPAEEISEAEKAIAEFEMQEENADLGEAESEIDAELYGVMAELGQIDSAETEEDREAEEELLETDAFEEMFGELMAEEGPAPEENDNDYAEYDNEEQAASREAEVTEEPAPAEEYSEEAAAEAESETYYETEETFEEAAAEAEVPVVRSASGYALPDDMRQSMSEFLLIEGMEQRIVDIVSAISDRKRAGDLPAGNLIVTGDIKSGKTFLAIELIKAVTEELGSHNGKVAKVQAELLNGKNIEKVFEKIGGSDLIIENVGYLDDRTIEDLTDVISSGRFTTMVIIEGNQLAVESIFASFPEFAGLFENRIDINELSIVQWADIAIKYADEKGFALDDMAKLALHARINEINVPTARLGYDEVLDIMDDAIAKAEKRNSGKLFAAFKKNEDDKLEIMESDFM